MGTLRGKALSQCPLPAWGSCPGWQRWAPRRALPKPPFPGHSRSSVPRAVAEGSAGTASRSLGGSCPVLGASGAQKFPFSVLSQCQHLQWHGPQWHREAVPALGVRPEGSHLAHSWLRDTLASPEEHQGWGQPRFQLFSRPPTPVTNRQHLARATWAEGTAPDREPGAPTAEEKQGEGTHSWQSHHPCTPGTAGAPPHPSLPGPRAQRNSVAQMQPPKKADFKRPPLFFFFLPPSPRRGPGAGETAAAARWKLRCGLGL